MLGFIVWAVGTFGRKIGEDIHEKVTLHNLMTEIEKLPEEQREAARQDVLARPQEYIALTDKIEAEIWKELAALRLRAARLWARPASISSAGCIVACGFSLAGNSLSACTAF